MGRTVVVTCFLNHVSLQSASSTTAKDRSIPQAALDPFISSTLVRDFLMAFNDGFLHKNCLM